MTAGFQNLERGEYAIAAAAFADAERLYRERAAPRTQVAEMMGYRAWCYAKLGRSHEAVKLYAEAIELEREADANPERIAELREQLDWAKAKLNSGD